MRRTIFYILVLLTICAIASCAVNPQGSKDPSENTTVSTPAQTDPTGGSEQPTDNVPDTVIPEGTDPEQTVPQSTKPQPTMPSVGIDPGGFGPIF